VYVRDLDSANGTFLNGNRVNASLPDSCEDEGAAINHGDFLTIGGTTLRVDILNCPPAMTDTVMDGIWSPGETMVKDCPMPC
jgi:pSer/pThr/pTyr-binding forkhead associated (FHA) protein